jgi:hypothetical protein
VSKAYNKLWPQQARAKWRVQKAVQEGRMQKPDTCDICRWPFPKNKIHAHHYDYSKPLEVSWLCDSCHKAVHKDLGKDWKESTG